MNFFGKSKEKDKLMAVFDIGSFSVGGALFYKTKSGVPRIVFSVREFINLEKEFIPDNFFNLTLKSLSIVASKLHKSGLGAPDKFFCVLSSPWYESEIRTINLKKNVPFVFNMKLANSMIEKGITLFKEECAKKNEKENSNMIPIELKSMKTTLNGYTVSNLFDQKAKEVEMSVFVSLSHEQILKRIEDTLKKHFLFENLKFSSFTMASFTVARDMFMSHEDFFLINLGGEITDISMVKKDILKESISFPVGHNFIIRGVAKTLNCSLSEAESLISLYKEGHMAESALKEFDPVIDKFKKEWLQHFQNSLANISNDISIPATIFITADLNFSEFFCQIIKSEEFSQHTMTESEFKVVFLGTQALHGIAIEENIARDPFITIESVYINRFLN